jgi:hypothetical protein
MKRLSTPVCIAVAPAAASQTLALQGKPNLDIILTDDQGSADMACSGGKSFHPDIVQELRATADGAIKKLGTGKQRGTEQREPGHLDAAEDARK